MSIMSSQESEKRYQELDVVFSKYKHIMDKNETQLQLDRWNIYCLNFDDKFDTVDKFRDKDKLCPQAMRYLYNIYSDVYSPPEKNHFKYLYYWIYKHHLKAGKDRNYIKDFYKEIIRVYEKQGYFLSNVDSSKKDIFDKELEVITDICDYSTKLNDIKNNTFKSCKSSQKCNCANECADIYLRRYNACETIGVVIFFLPYNSCLHREIKKIINKCRDLKKEWSKLDNSEIYNNIYLNNNFNVLYSSHYIDE
ncbi:variable surface protein [Plasmodium gonderi]|uniref:Variable surface protein n=1 Tax=Plasmodium gonderi TaxID=77519 RepID=A0A1Y1JPI8_PLAGO|nr:variable surface protein [Plasmodium gonderi]GAW84170.1 variable surface protein [Plasmodium gonderi]